MNNGAVFFIIKDPGLVFVGKGKPLKSAPLGYAQTLLANDRLGWKDLTDANALAYLILLSVTMKKVLLH